MSEHIELKVHLAFDPEAKVWYVAKSDIPGLSLEAESPDALVHRIMECAPEMVELNIAEIVQAKAISHVARPRKRLVDQPTSRPHLSLLSVFDSSMDLACA